MAHPLHHAQSSAQKFGGVPADYQRVHDWFDASKAHMAFVTHRALRHHSLGIFEAERVFGLSLRNSAGRDIPTRWIGEQHVKEDCHGKIPSIADWFRKIPPETWMANGHIDLCPKTTVEDPSQSWRTAVADGKTVLGLQDWIDQQCQLQRA